MTTKLFVCTVLGLLAVAVHAQMPSTTAAPHDPCRVCQILIGIARRHFNNNINDQAALQAQLLMECDNLAQHGFTQQEVAGCKATVNGKIGAIFVELRDHPTESNHMVCVDINECAALKKFAFARSERGWLCSACEEVFKEIDQLLPSAEGLTEEALKVFLDGLCDEVPFVSGILKDLVNKYLDDIFHYIEEHGTISAQGICHLLHCC